MLWRQAGHPLEVIVQGLQEGIQKEWKKPSLKEWENFSRSEHHLQKWGWGGQKDWTQRRPENSIFWVHLLCQASALYLLMSALKGGFNSFPICRQGNRGLGGLDSLDITRLANEESEQNTSQHPLWPWWILWEGTGFSSSGRHQQESCWRCVGRRGADRESGVVCRLWSPQRVFESCSVTRGLWLCSLNHSVHKRKMTLLRSERVDDTDVRPHVQGKCLERRPCFLLWSLTTQTLGVNLLSSQCRAGTESVSTNAWWVSEEIKGGARGQTQPGSCWTEVWWWRWRGGREGQGDQGECLKGTCTPGPLWSPVLQNRSPLNCGVLESTPWVIITVPLTWLYL